MRQVLLLTLMLTGLATVRAQNDVDAIRYSRTGTGGTARFAAMGGAFGALGADLSCASFNPGGLGLFRRGEISFTGGLQIVNSNAYLNKSNSYTGISDANFAFNNFGIAVAWNSAKDPESRHVLAFSESQLNNFFSTTRISGYVANQSIAGDMLNLARQGATASSPTGGLDPGYEGLAFNTFLLDTADNQFFSFEDTRRTVMMTRDIVTSGRLNDMNFAYSYAYKDKYYIGASLGLPQVRYESNTVHTEVDDRDSMRIGMTGASSYTTTYLDEPPVVYTDKLGFSALQYQEYFKTTGSGLNLKLGGVVRLNDMVRVGAYYHTPTIYRLTDEYFSQMDVYFDAAPKSAVSLQYPDKGGFYKYRIITPSRLGFNVGIIAGKRGAIGLDYEAVNYAAARLSSTDNSSFSGVNALIARRYSVGNNIRLGGELNLSPIMLRAGYSMQGSPYGHVFSGHGVRHQASIGAGFRGKGSFYADIAIIKWFTTDDYSFYSTQFTSASIVRNNTMLSITGGLKF